MIQVNRIYDLCNYITNKEQMGNTINASEFNTILYAVNIDFFRQRYGLPQEYVPGQPLPKMSYEITQKIIDDLSHFKVRMGIDTAAMTIDAQGRANIPSDYVHFSSAIYHAIKDNVCGKVDLRARTVEHLSEAQRPDRIGNSIKMPTLRNSVYVTFNNYFQFYPKNLKYVEFTYLRMPRTPIYATTIDPNTDLEVYNPTTSVHFEYPEDCFTELVTLCLSYTGVNLRSADIVQYSQILKEKGI